ncbi:MAG: PorV/PorQ family protein [Candidatus Eisenbacteria bacterium]|nr:PorV/PorQ family protein [Candidatus Eisenbacteria bacterium]
MTMIVHPPAFRFAARPVERPPSRPGARSAGSGSGGALAVARPARAVLAVVMLALASLAAGPAGADISKAGTTAAGFLSVGTGASILGMGGATLGLGGDLAAVPWNAAALGTLGQTQVALAHAALADQTGQEWAAVGGRLGRGDTRWALSGLYQSEGSFEGRDASNLPTGSFDVSSTALGLHLARPLGMATLGLGARYVGEKLGSVSGSGFTMDAGLLVRAGLFGFGLSATNVGGSMSYGGSSWPFPRNVGAGLALDLPGTGLRAALDANFPAAYYNDVRAGLEWRWRGLFAARAGYRRELGAPSSEPLTGPAFGMGAGARGLWLDYAYLIPGAGDGQHRIALALKPGMLGWLSGGGAGIKDMPRSFDDVPPGGVPQPAPQKGKQE